MLTLLAVAEWICGPTARALVFEALAADAQDEMRRSRWPFATRVRWMAAILVAIVTCASRGTFGRLPSSLILDLGKRALTFGTLAYALQWMAAGMTTNRAGAGFPPSIATTVPFLIIPVVWRICVASIPQHQKRLLSIAVATACIALSISGAESWLVWSGYAAGIAWLTLCGWRLGDPAVAEEYQLLTKTWYRTVMVATALMVAGWTVRLAMQIGLLTPFWPRHQLLISYMMAAAITLAIEDVPTESHRTV